MIHYKFVVTDFNGADPQVFTGSSNLASGGETSNGDNLIAFSDRDIVTIYAVEAIRLVDYFHFRAVWQSATGDRPLQLQGPTPPTSQKRWWEPYYDKSDGNGASGLLSSPAP